MHTTSVLDSSPATALDAFSLFWLQLCRLGTYATLNLLDDPALLALAFC